MLKKLKKILIVEDERPIRQALGLKLENVGFSITSAVNGKEALSIIGETKFDLILLDLVMPEIDGYEVLTQLKKGGINTPVIVLSNLGQEDDVKKAKDLGAEDYFVKSDTPLSRIVEKVKKQIK